MKTLLSVFLTLVILILAGLFIAPMFVDSDGIKTKIQEAISEQTGWDAELGKLSLRLLPAPYASIDNFVLKDGAKPLAKMDQARVEIALMPLFSQNVLIREISFQSPEILVETYADGTLNWTPQPIQKGASGTVQTSPDNKQANGWDIKIEEFEIENGKLSYSDGSRTTLVNIIDAELEMESLEGPYSIEAEINVPQLDIKSDTQSVQNTAKTNGKSVSPTQIGAPWSDDVIDTSFVNQAATASIDLSITQLQSDFGVIEDIEADIGFDKNKFSLRDFSANMLGTEIEGSAEAKAATSGRGFSNVALNFGAEDIDLSRLGREMLNLPNDQITGVLNDVNIDFQTSGATSRALAQSLNGAVTANGQDIQVSGLNLDGLAEQLTGDFQLTPQLIQNGLRGGTTSFESLAVDIPVQSGVAHLKTFALEGDVADARLTGQADLSNWRLNLGGDVSLDRGEWPKLEVAITGPISRPMTRVNTDKLLKYAFEKVGRDKIKSVIDDKIGGKLGDVLGGALEESAPNKKNAQETAPASAEDVLEDAAKDLLKGLF